MGNSASLQRRSAGTWLRRRLDDVAAHDERFTGNALVWEVKAGHYGSCGTSVLELVKHLRSEEGARASICAVPSRKGRYEIHAMPHAWQGAFSTERLATLDARVWATTPLHRLDLEQAQRVYRRLLTALIVFSCMLVRVWFIEGFMCFEMPPFNFHGDGLPPKPLSFIAILTFVPSVYAAQQDVAKCRASFERDDLLWRAIAPQPQPLAAG